MQAGAGKRTSVRIAEIPDSALVQQRAGTVNEHERAAKTVLGSDDVIRLGGELGLVEAGLVRTWEERIVDERADRLRLYLGSNAPA